MTTSLYKAYLQFKHARFIFMRRRFFVQIRIRLYPRQRLLRRPLELARVDRQRHKANAMAQNLYKCKSFRVISRHIHQPHPATQSCSDRDKRDQMPLSVLLPRALYEQHSQWALCSRPDRIPTTYRRRPLVPLSPTRLHCISPQRTSSHRVTLTTSAQCHSPRRKSAEKGRFYEGFTDFTVTHIRHTMLRLLLTFCLHHSASIRRSKRFVLMQKISFPTTDRKKSSRDVTQNHSFLFAFFTSISLKDDSKRHYFNKENHNSLRKNVLTFARTMQQQFSNANMPPNVQLPSGLQWHFSKTRRMWYVFNPCTTERCWAEDWDASANRMRKSGMYKCLFSSQVFSFRVLSRSRQRCVYSERLHIERKVNST